eukprot:XP_781935.2 PREDICTED: PDZ domain-containing protein 11 [Strongylocentrotus purpuratus]
MSYETFPVVPHNEAAFNQANLPPRYQTPPPWIPPKERVGHPDYDNNLSKFLLRSVKFRRSKSNEQLGFSIRGGADYGCRIYISGVIPDSVAFRVGMKPGDLILSINSVDFSNITYDEAIKVLKNLDEIEARLKYYPYGYYKTYERTGEAPPIE